MATPTRKNQRNRAGAPNPMEEENFPDNPTRRAADREMNEPSNLRPSGSPMPRREPPAREMDEDG